jgi:hypothetical protein
MSTRNPALSGERAEASPQKEPMMYAKERTPQYMSAKHTICSCGFCLIADTSPYPVEVTVVTAQ